MRSWVVMIYGNINRIGCHSPYSVMIALWQIAEGHKEMLHRSRQMARFSLVIALAILLFTGSAVVMFGWISGTPVWVYVFPDSTAMVFNTALCLVLMSIALALPELGRKHSIRVRPLIGWFIVLLTVLIIAENVSGIALGVDWSTLHSWFQADDPSPGRMPLYIALALLVAGITIGLDSQRGMVWIMRSVFPATVLTLGLLGLLGYIVHHGFSYTWYGLPRIALSSGIMVVLLGVALMLEQHGFTVVQPRWIQEEVRSYSFLGIAVTILLSIAIVSYGSIKAVEDRTRWVEHTHEVLQSLEELISQYDRARNAEKSFILSGGMVDRDEFDSARTCLPDKLDGLMRLTADNPRQQSRLAAMQRLIGQDMARLGERMRIKRPGISAEEAVAQLPGLDVNRTRINTVAEEFRIEEVRLLTERKRESEKSSRSIILLIIVGNAVGFGLLLYAFWMIKRQSERRTEAEQRLSSSNKFLDSLIENIPNMIFVKDAKDLRFLRFNEAGEKLLGYSRAELVGKNDYDFFPKEEADVFSAKDRAALASQQLLDIPEEPIHTKSRGTRILHTMKIPVLDDQGIPLYLLGISEDITERKQAEQAISKLNTELGARAAQLAATNKELESFSYSVSHDLRAPLRAIDGFARMFEEDYASRLDNEASRYLTVIRRNSQRMGALIDDLLAFSKLGRHAVSKSIVNLDKLVQEVIDEALQHHHGEKQPKFDVGPLPPAHADRALLKQVWVNLISNAIKYTGKSPQPIIQVTGVAEQNENIYVVKDNGTGFSMEYYDKLFGVFQRLHHADEYSGTGVGLAIVHRVVTRHGGRVWAEGKVNEGAVFSFTLPAGEKCE